MRAFEAFVIAGFFTGACELTALMPDESLFHTRLRFVRATPPSIFSVLRR